MPEPAQPIERKLAAVFAADVAGYSRLMGQDELGTLRRLAAHREIMDGLIGEHRGRIANTAGLPFENMSGTTEDEYFADGITEDLIGATTIRVSLVEAVIVLQLTAGRYYILTQADVPLRQIPVGH